jgi:hypothetical protein
MTFIVVFLNPCRQIPEHCLNQATTTSIQVLWNSSNALPFGAIGPDNGSVVKQNNNNENVSPGSPKYSL